MSKALKIVIIVALSVVVLLGITAAVLHFNNFHIELSLNGEKNITLEYGEKYTENGAIASLKGKFILKEGKPVEVVTTGKVDDTKLGTYTLLYSASVPRRTASVTRTVTVVDTTVPVIKLKGNAEVTITRGNKFTDEGVEATDNYDGDLTSSVAVEGSVDTSKAGEYTLKYTVKDTSGNEAAVLRKVTVKAPAVKPTVTMPPISTVYPGEKTVYLTFDDGPGAYTSQLLDVLAKYNVKATFFVINTGFNHIISRMAAEGHAVGLHTASHDYKKIYSSEEAFFNDLEAIQSVVVAKTGKRTNLIRFPGGSSNTVSSFNPGIMSRLAVSVTQKGYRYFDWNVDSRDAGGASTSTEVANNVISGISKRGVSVVLQHDIKKFSVNAVEQIIKWGLANGYAFKALDESSPVCHHGINN